MIDKPVSNNYTVKRSFQINGGFNVHRFIFQIDRRFSVFLQE